MRISVIITTYNRPDMLSKVFEGLAYQTESADEVIVADDGSGGETEKIVHRFYSYLYIRFITFGRKIVGLERQGFEIRP